MMFNWISYKYILLYDLLVQLLVSLGEKSTERVVCIKWNKHDNSWCADHDIFETPTPRYLTWVARALERFAWQTHRLGTRTKKSHTVSERQQLGPTLFLLLVFCGFAWYFIYLFFLYFLFLFSNRSLLFNTNCTLF